ncbi:MAG: ABC transporter permease subunit [Clostridia bacterium]|nr:ABC transporter permease subunit [Clostridia bacterium]
MIKREFRVNFKSFIIWLSIILVMFLVVFLVYPYIITDDTVKNMDELMKVFPEEVLKTFNMDMESVSTAYGWLKTEGFMFVLLIVGFYSSITGGTVLLKEENDKTIEYLCSLPIKRSKIVTNKIAASLTYIISMILILGVFNYIALILSGDFDQKQFILLSITPVFIALPLFALNMFISTFMHKTRKTVGICLGMVFVFYLLNVLSELSSNVEYIKYLSVYTLADVRNVISNVAINPLNVIISLLLTALLLIGTYIRYNKKELV